MGNPITASMLYDLIQCPHRVTLDLTQDPANRIPISPFVQLLWERGNAFEQQVIDNLEIPFVNLRPFSNQDRERLTIERIAAGEPLIYGGRIRADDLLGEPDLLRRIGDGYGPGDIKSGAGVEGLSEDTDGKPKKHYGVQLALYCDILERLGQSAGRLAFVWDIHGNEVSYDLEARRGPKTPTSLWDAYQDCLSEARRIVTHQAETQPACISECKLCHWRPFCSERVVEMDDLTLIPELGRSRRDRLSPIVSTVRELAAADLSTLEVPGLGVNVLRRFHARARLQVQPDPKPYLTAPFALPSPDLELFFDVETDPFKDICYLHGFLERRDGNPETENYVECFAESESIDQEREAFARAWEYIRRVQPSAIYYYSPYERTAWRRLAAKHPDVARRSEVDELFASNTTVDLYIDVVRSKMEWPTRDLSIKTLATYLGFHWRDPDPSGAASIEWFHRWTQSRDRSVRQRILEYNHDDCIATRVLVDAIRTLVRESEIEG